MTSDDDNEAITMQPAVVQARILFAVLVALMLVAALFSERFFDAIGEWIAEDPDQALQRFDVFVAWIGVLSLPLLIAGILTFRNGYRAVRSKRYPPQGMWLIVDTPVQHGARAVFRGRMMQMAGALMSAIAVGFPLALWKIVHSIV